MVIDIIKDLVVTAISAGIFYCLKKVVNFIKDPQNNEGAVSPNSKRFVLHQFFISLVLLVISLISATAFPWSFGLLGGIKAILFVIAGFCFIFVWGAFDAAFTFYPNDEPRNNEPPDNPSHKN